ncbi:uncharacterized protein LOC109504006 isoform X2 [Harpegnathos saltator]|uniref:uncharacterized protein LOC109504006 isoform X2 n=1 Tax=Harpegnathos saltator TaxID=610380 RepID=UPI000DBEDE39|nr:uncharacterized protein LOC109504006 isoform X2 [Harpegnathos saltator]
MFTFCHIAQPANSFCFRFSGNDGHAMDFWEVPDFRRCMQNRRIRFGPCRIGLKIQRKRWSRDEFLEGAGFFVHAEPEDPVRAVQGRLEESKAERGWPCLAVFR